MNLIKNIVIVALTAITFQAFAQHQHGGHSQGVDSRGDKAMGFSHEKTQHHFRLFKDGGSIDVVVKDKSDTGQVDAIRSHLKMISGMFAKGDFQLPMFIHDRTVPGQKTMEAMRKSISYRYAVIQNGARVRIQASNPKAIAAIHSFLKFQITDHRTGDSGKVERMGG